MTKGFDLTPRIDNFNGYNDLKIYINGLEIREFELIDLQIDYGIEERGFISFSDSLGILEIAPLTFSTLEIMIIDKLKTKQTKKYLITKVETIRTSSNIISLDLEFEEINTYRLKNSYISKSFKNITILEIIEKIFLELGIKAEINNKDEGYRFDYFVIPGNISIFDFISNYSEIADFKYFVDRLGWVFSTRDNFNFSKLQLLNESEFSFFTDEPYWKVLEYKGKISNVKEIRKCVNSVMTNPDIEDLKYNPVQISTEDIYTMQKLNSYSGIENKSVSDIISNIGVKQINHIYNTDILGDNIDFREYMKSTQDISIAVQGALSIRMYGVIKLQIPRSKMYKDDTPDSIFSGKFVVTGVIDKIMAGKYFQILELKSSDYSEFKVK